MPKSVKQLINEIDLWKDAYHIRYEPLQGGCTNDTYKVPLQREQFKDNPAKHRPREKERKKDTRLHRLHKPFKPQLVQQQRQNERDNKTEHDLQYGNNECIPQHLIEIREIEYVREVVPAYELRLEKAEYRLEFLKCHDETEHRSIAVYERYDDPRNEHQVQRPFSPHLFHTVNDDFIL